MGFSPTSLPCPRNKHDKFVIYNVVQDKQVSVIAEVEIVALFYFGNIVRNIAES